MRRTFWILLLVAIAAWLLVGIRGCGNNHRWAIYRNGHRDVVRGSDMSMFPYQGSRLVVFIYAKRWRDWCEIYSASADSVVELHWGQR